jgi:hypothetical protein
MKLTIFGKHPIPQGGFNGVMSLFEALGFSKLGYEVTLAIPFVDKDEYKALITKNSISNLNELNKFGGKFDITPVFPDGENFNKCDILVYQSYFQKDHELFWNLCCERSRLRTKNFPKFVTSPYALREGHIIGQFSQFHLIACALQEDVLVLNSDTVFKKEFKDCYAYVPRGASPEFLHPGFKLGIPPSIGLDTPNGKDANAIKHYFSPIKRLKRDFPDLRVFSVGSKIDEIDSVAVPFGRFDRIYDHFFNQIHAYLAINYEFSPTHLTARVQKDLPEWRRKAIYEVQNIEAQMSGAVLLGHRSNLISELYESGQSGFNFSSYENEEEIYTTLKHIVTERHSLSRLARNFALQNFQWDHAIGKWSDAIQTKLSSMR